MITYYTDGSASPNPGPGGFAVIKNSRPHILGGEPSGAHTTNIRMEGLAIKSALMDADGEECQIFTDSEFWINVITKWSLAWEKSGWKKKGGDIKNLDIVKDVCPLYRNSKATLTWVRGHNDDVGNELADTWANKARERKTTDPVMVEPEKQMTAQEYATELLATAKLAQLATVADGKPWVSTVFFVADADNAIYWLSEPHRRHSQEIANNPYVAVAVAAKTDKPVIGFQGSGTVSVVTDYKSVEQVIADYIAKYNGAGKDFLRLAKADKNKHVLYKMTPDSLVMFDELHFADNPQQTIIG